MFIPYKFFVSHNYFLSFFVFDISEFYISLFSTSSFASSMLSFISSSTSGSAVGSASQIFTQASLNKLD
jgi:hypothetical protein